jgi:hypothetical protein
MKKRYSVMPADDATVDSDEMKAVFRVAVDVKMPSEEGCLSRLKELELLFATSLEVKAGDVANVERDIRAGDWIGVVDEEEEEGKAGR